MISAIWLAYPNQGRDSFSNHFWSPYEHLIHSQSENVHAH